MSKSSKGILVGSISGFPELLPKEQVAFNTCLDFIKKQFESYGFSPMDTPAVEKASTLLSKGNDSEIYGLCRLTSEEGSKKELGLRFDLTVPLARYVAEHYGQLIFPFKRYHIAPVWRGERAQAGRYRQFYQCDIDIIGETELSLAYDAELLGIIHKIFSSIGLPNYRIKINNRKILMGLMQEFGVEENQVEAAIRQIDKKEKIDALTMEKGLEDLGLAKKVVHLITTFLEKKGTNQQMLDYLAGFTKSDLLQEGLRELKEVIQLSQSFDVTDSILEVDPTLARGLNYYTGTIYETKWMDCLEIGTICAGGRYQNLAETFTRKVLPGVGVSIGVSRLIPKMIEKGLIKSDAETYARVLVTVQNRQFLPHYISLAEKIRSHGIGAEVYLQDKPLPNQIKYADRKGFEIVVIANEDEIRMNSLNFKILKEQRQEKGSIETLIEFLSR
ncbi:MAG: histidine--tRNA ligase [Chlamydiae bacterium]|nr:histidine--tRNA ligase [Chlamydiota bacterium]